MDRTNLKKVNLNARLAEIDVDELENGISLFLVKTGRKENALQVIKNSISARITLYSGKKAEYGYIIDTILINENRYNCRRFPKIDRKFIEDFEKIANAIKSLIDYKEYFLR